ncbi:MAG: L,D-transpeptidase family protein [Lachnospiraceae bacterium]
MALTRKQKRWLREHRGLVTFVKVLVAVIVIGTVYGVAAYLNEGLRPQNLVKYIASGGQEMETQAETVPEVTAPVYESNIVVFDGEEELTEAQKAALEYQVDPSVEKPYMIKVNRALNTVTVYGIDANGFYSIPVKAMVCSTGKEVGDTPLGNGKITDKYTFHPMVDGTYGQYAVRYMDGGILFHSVPYYEKEKDQLETDQFNKLGEVASLGCVRLCVRDALWIYENCPKGTDVVVYDDTSDPGPLGKPEMIKIPMDSQFAGWDPTDPDEANPWKQFSAKIEGAQDITINVGETVDPLRGVTATDTCGNDITDKITLKGSVDIGIPGTYSVILNVEDAIGSCDAKEITVTVVD